MGKLSLVFKAACVAAVCAASAGGSLAVSAETVELPRIYASSEEKTPAKTEKKNEKMGLRPSAYHVPGSLFSLSGASLPSSYRSETTEIKNQGAYETCWAFANISALETFLIKDGKGRYDLAENHLAWWSTAEYNSDGIGWLFDDLYYGGYSMVGAGYLASWQGAKYESDFPYQTYGNEIPYDMESGEIPFNVTGIMYVANDIESVKSAVYKYGAVATSYNSNDKYYNSGKTSYYQPDSDFSAGHAITIVGWDDYYSADNFSEKPPGDGAWLIKNSWGDSMCEDGYLWISYYDAMLLDTNTWGSNVVITSARTNKGYDRLYQNEIYGATWYTFLMNPDESVVGEATFVNVFNFDDVHKYLQKVIFETKETGVTYTAYYIPVVNGIPDSNRKNWQKLANGKSSISGYISVDTGGFEVPAGPGAIGVTVDSGDSMGGASMGVDEWLSDMDGNYVFMPAAMWGHSYVINGSDVYDLMEIYGSSNDDIGGTLVIKAVASEHCIGDVTGDGRSSTADALHILRNSIGMKKFDDEQKINADTNFDGKISAADSLRVQRKAVGLISEF